MLWSASRLPKQDKNLALLQAALGVSTIVYNARNYWLIKEALAMNGEGLSETQIGLR